jgi:DNA-binding MarR family transcriptional regulator
MPAKRKLTMRQLRQMLRLARDGASSREIARVLGVARSTVQENLTRAADVGLSWPLPGDLGSVRRRGGISTRMRV